MSIDGKRNVITGGTLGIGATCTRHFCELGAKVVFASNQDDEGIEDYQVNKQVLVSKEGHY